MTRHLDPRHAQRVFQWSTIDGRQYPVLGGKVFRGVKNATFDPVATPAQLVADAGDRPVADVLARFRDSTAALAAQIDALSSEQWTVVAEAPPGHLPVRGDLAHIALAGRYFVPHYAVPMAHIAASGGAILRDAANADAEEVATLEAGAPFAVLEIVGGWAWGQVGTGNDSEGGWVGYIATSELDTVTA